MAIFQLEIAGSQRPVRLASACQSKEALDKMRLFRPVIQPLLVLAATIKRRMLSNSTFITITGSVGKTTTTQLLGAILSRRHAVRVGGHRNTPPDVLKAVCSTSRSDEFAVIEVSGGDPGDIEKSRDIVQARAGVITAVGLDHYSNFRSREAVAAEKGKLIENLPHDGYAILNGDDPYVRGLSERTRAQVIYFGKSEDCDVRAENISCGWPDRLAFTLCYQGEAWPVQSRLVDEMWILTILASVAAALAVGATIHDCVEAVEEFEPVFGRMSPHTSANGVNFLLDTKKASNWTMPFLIDYIAKSKAPKKTVVIGNISDTPGSSNSQVRKWTKKCLQVADRVIGVGAQSAAIEKLMTSEFDGRLFRFETVKEADEFLRQTSTPGELIFAKSSSRLHLERIWLSRKDELKCWLEPCPVRSACFECRWYSTPAPPRPAGRLVRALR